MNQELQLECLRLGENGSDTPTYRSARQSLVAYHYNQLATLSPEDLLLIKEKYEAQFDNPCYGCPHDDETDPYILDYCHYHCKADTVKPVVLR